MQVDARQGPLSYLPIAMESKHLDMVIWEIDPATRIPFLSCAFAKFLGFSHDSLPPSYPLFSARVFRADQERLLKQIHAILDYETGETLAEFGLVAADGKVRTIKAKLQKEISESGVVVITGSWEDLTDLRNVELQTESVLTRTHHAERMLEFGTWTLDPVTRGFSGSDGLRVAFGFGIDGLDALLSALPEACHLEFLSAIHDLTLGKSIEPKCFVVRETESFVVEIRIERQADQTLFGTLQRLVRKDMRVEPVVSESELHLRAAIDRSFDSIFVLKSDRNDSRKIRDFIIVELNKNAEQLIEMDRTMVIGQRLCELLPINRTGGFFDKYVRVVETGIPLDEEFEILNSERVEWLHHQVVPVDDGICITTRDITVRKRAEQALINSERLIHTITASSPDILFLYDLPKGKNVYWSRSLAAHLGNRNTGEGDVDATGFRHLIHPDDLENWSQAEEKLRTAGDEDSQVLRFRLKDATGEWLWFESRNSVFLRDESGTPVQVLYAVRDITEQRVNEDQLNERLMELRQARDQLRQRQVELELLNERLAALASTDGLTGLNNHRGFQDRLRAELEHSQKTELPVALILTDVDHFKDINDRLGHPAGDEVLREFSRVLADTARTADFVARYGGEEFAIILPSATAEEAVRFCERVRKRLKDPEGMNSLITASFGCADSQSHPGGKAQLIAAADRALYRSKHEGRDRITVASGVPTVVDTSVSAVQN